MGWLGELPILLFRGIGGPEIAIVAIVLLLIFGASRLPKIGTSLGRSLRAFKSGVTGLDEGGDGGEESDAEKGKSAVKNKEQS